MRLGFAFVLTLTACSLQNEAAVDPSFNNPGGVGPHGGTSGLPCDVQTILQTNCTSCHGSAPSGGAPMALVTYADLTRPAVTQPQKTVAQLSVERMASAQSPMPPAPAPAVSSADQATFAAWVQAGTPMGNCQLGPDPFGVGPTCSTGSYYQPSGDDGSSTMNPGMACISCHSQGEGPWFSIAGTVYQTGHEPDLCNGGSSTVSAKVVITDANGAVITRTVNPAGNFDYRYPIALPYHAKVVDANGNERAMQAAQTSGDCNSCHTQTGANGAPGRIVLP